MQITADLVYTETTRVFKQLNFESALKSHQMNAL